MSLGNSCRESFGGEANGPVENTNRHTKLDLLQDNHQGVGASVIFFQRLVKLASKLVLAGGLAFSAGIMLYVSFIEPRRV